MTDRSPRSTIRPPIEAALYAWWQDARPLSRRRPAPPAEPYVIMMPPPNVTAVLHMGHGLNNTIQDVLIRFERMRGRNGALAAGHRPRRHRHAERGRAAAREGRARPASTSGASVRRAGLELTSTRPAARFSSSSRRSAPAATGSRTYFTLDDGALPRGARGVRPPVREGPDLPRASTSSTGAPAASPRSRTRRPRRKRRDGQLWHLRYPLADGSGSSTVATTRPETMLGDTGVAVHPDDARYQRPDRPDRSACRWPTG